VIAVPNDDQDEEEVDEDDGQPIIQQPVPAARDKTLHAMHQLATFYNPMATNYVQDANSNDDTVATSNQLGREGADAANPDPNDDLDADSKTHGLQEDGSFTSDASLERHVLLEDVSDEDQASAAIDYLPNFAFYSHNQLLAPPSDSEQLDFQNAFEHQMIEPTMFQEAYNHKDPEQCAKWRAAIHKEFKDMNNRGVWCKVKRSTIPQGHRCIKSKWVFKIKRDGVFRARLVACRYSQIPGIDFTENYAPVMNDVTWRILLFAMIVWNLNTIIVDVETAFLHGDLEEEIYMNLPDGMEGMDNECLLLLKALYSLVQGARQWWKKFITILKNIEFKGGLLTLAS